MRDVSHNAKYQYRKKQQQVVSFVCGLCNWNLSAESLSLIIHKCLFVTPLWCIPDGPGVWNSVYMWRAITLCRERWNALEKRHGFEFWISYMDAVLRVLSSIRWREKWQRTNVYDRRIPGLEQRCLFSHIWPIKHKEIIWVLKLHTECLKMVSQECYLPNAERSKWKRT